MPNFHLKCNHDTSFCCQRILLPSGRSKKPCASKTFTIKIRMVCWIETSSSAGLHLTATARQEKRYPTAPTFVLDFSCHNVFVRLVGLCLFHVDGMISFVGFALVLLKGSSPHQRDGPRWRREDLSGRSLEESRSVHEQWSHGLRETAACVTWWTLTKLRAFSFVSLRIYSSVICCFHRIYVVTNWWLT